MSSIIMPSLPYKEDALAPVISSKTIEFHYGKHEKAYFDKTVALIKGTEYENLSLVEIIRKTESNPNTASIFNNAAQAWNHVFFWDGLSPVGTSSPKGKILSMIEKDFTSFKVFKEQFIDAAVNTFGSGWVWLVLSEDKLSIQKTFNAGTPISNEKVKPILTIDVWEHAYYLDYQNKRQDYVASVIDLLLNWEIANDRLAE